MAPVTAAKFSPEAITILPVPTVALVENNRNNPVPT